MPQRPILSTLAITVGLLMPVVTASAQSPPVPSIFASAQQEAKVTPDRATINISVQTKAPTAAASAAANAKKQTAVINSLRSLGLTNEQISTSNYSVQPEYKYEQNKEPVLTGYTVTNTVIADIKDVSIVGKVIDAVLSAGANMISSLDFYASNTDVARREAMGAAIAKARADAEAGARAAGGTLGTLLELTMDGVMPTPPPRPMYKTAMMADAVGGTPISPGQQTLIVTVSTKWLFIPSK